MRASVDMVLFLATVYDYFYGKGNQDQGAETDQQHKYQPDQPYHADMENDTDSPDNVGEGFHRYKSFQEQKVKRPSLFDDDEYGNGDDEEYKNRSSYRMLANDEQDRLNRENQEQGMLNNIKNRFKRVYNGASTIMVRYAKRRNDLNRQTVEQSETLTNARDYIASKGQEVSTKFTKLMHARRASQAINNMKSKFHEDFATL
ncbi:UNKNOWN [Stylonychia lemnae]|uniref:Uncharacterized protein n=1 Tax=Stylonychia lemnae TaxID=5949 RepID=A0A077ZSF2_STYLE|nr:UNKNOWN [Stylonychia lemnae]|eukprot:CDW72290.1 UNKNOWN [Stylonychia lemnae]